jgi:hypothetical protein
MASKTLQNLTDRPLPIFYEGTQYTLEARGQPGSTRPLPSDVADFAKAQYGNFVMELGEQDAVSYVNKVIDQDVWLANMTGNPDAPFDFLVKKVRNKKTGELEERREENENREPQIVEEQMGARHEFYEGKFMGISGTQGMNTRTIPARTWRIMPYQRVKVSALIAAEFLKRDMSRLPHQQGKVIQSRAPGEFEPRMNWPPDQKRAWLELVDQKFRRNPALLGKSEKDIRAEFGDDKISKAAADQAVAEADDTLWRHCVLRTFDPTYALPSERDFEIYAKRNGERLGLTASKK